MTTRTSADSRWLRSPEKIRTCLELAELQLNWLQSEVRRLVEGRECQKLQRVHQEVTVTEARGIDWLLSVIDAEIIEALRQPGCDANQLYTCERVLSRCYQRWLALMRTAAAAPRDPLCWGAVDQRIEAVEKMLDPDHPLNLGQPGQCGPETE